MMWASCGAAVALEQFTFHPQASDRRPGRFTIRLSGLQHRVAIGEKGVLHRPGLC